MEGNDRYNVDTINEVLYRNDQQSVDSGDVELGTVVPPTSATHLARTSAVVSGSHIIRPIIHRGNSKSGMVNNVASGKEEVRVQSAWIRSEHLQSARPSRNRRSSLTAKPPVSSSSSTKALTDKVKKIRRHEKQISTNSSMTTSNHHSSKHGMYMVSSRRLDFSEPNDTTTSRSLHTNSEQFCLQKVLAPTRTSRFLKWFGFGGTVLSIYDNSPSSTKSCTCFGIELNLIVINSFMWMFRQSFTALVVTLVAGFILISLIFAIGVYIVGTQAPHCIGGVDFSTNSRNYFTDAYILSWTTLSTCGYGVIHPTIPTHVGDCVIITVMMATEGFIGVLYGCICSAIFFAKISRVQSFAQVDFSEVICVRYGSGVSEEKCNANKLGNSTILKYHMEDETSSSLIDETEYDIPCPVLEFRVVNRMHDVQGGEIVDTRVNVVASIDESNISSIIPSNKCKTNTNAKRRGKNRRNARQQQRVSYYHGISERILGKSENSLESSAHLSDRIDTIPRSVLTKLECESLDHPFFKRVFTIRHRLDENSPLLKPRPKLMIQQNRGYWPSELNDAKSVRNSIHFDQLIIRLTGLSNADANTVFSHTVYDFQDLRVGHQFTHMLYRSEFDGSLRADTSLLNHIVQQEGGGGEVISQGRVRKIRDVSMLL